MGQDTKLLLALLLLLTLVKGNGQTCDVSKLEIQQAFTGRKINLLVSVFEVTVTNRCPCMVDNVVIWGPHGFGSVIGIDPKVFSIIRRHIFLLNDANPIQSSQSLTFQYAWDDMLEIEPAFFAFHC